tara:strand:+ start:763 stop:1044 length:282 start_codon:yes stop_codon:yes gene_type:complete
MPGMDSGRKKSRLDRAMSLAKSRETGKLTDKDIAAAMQIIEELNPGKSVDVTEMAMGGYMDGEIEKKMMGGYMGGGYMGKMAMGGYMDKKGRK